MIKKIIGFFEEHKKVSFILMLVVLIVMWYFSSIPGGTIDIKGSIWPSMIYHFFIFYFLSFFVLMIIINKKIKISNIWTVVFISLIFSVLDEMHQFFVPLRTPSINDILTDLGGVVTALFLCYIIKRD